MMSRFGSLALAGATITRSFLVLSFFLPSFLFGDNIVKLCERHQSTTHTCDHPFPPDGAENRYTVPGESGGIEKVRFHSMDSIHAMKAPWNQVIEPMDKDWHRLGRRAISEDVWTINRMSNERDRSNGSSS